MYRIPPDAYHSVVSCIRVPKGTAQQLAKAKSDVKICMLGSGALGSTIGGTLAAGGSDVTLVDVFQDHVSAVNTHGLRMRAGDSEKVVPVKAATDCRGLGVMDLVIVLVKSFHTREAIEAATPHIVGPDTVVMSLQNGMGHEDILAQVVGRPRVMAGKTYVGGVFLEPGRIIAGSQNKETVIGELDGTLSARARAIAAEFERAGLRTIVSDNIVGTIWDKLFVNVATGALAGITRLTYGDLYRVPEIEACAIAAVAEAMAVARANRVKLGVGQPREAWVKASEGLPAEFKTSMLQSLEKGAVTEIDFINGAVVRAGARAGVATPVNSTLVACIKGIGAASPRAAPDKRNRHTDSKIASRNKSYVEHVAFKVKDIDWHIRFFRNVLGMPVKEIEGPSDAPRQAWTVGGVQLIADPSFDGREGRLGHLGMMTDDVEAVIAAAKAWGIGSAPQGHNWLQLPDGLVIELNQAVPGAVDQALAVKPKG